MEFQKIPIYCPKCSSKVLTWNGITKIQMSTQCRYCGNYITFNPEKNEVKINKDIPQRGESGGKRFY